MGYDTPLENLRMRSRKRIKPRFGFLACMKIIEVTTFYRRPVSDRVIRNPPNGINRCMRICKLIVGVLRYKREKIIERGEQDASV